MPLIHHPSVPSVAVPQRPIPLILTLTLLLLSTLPANAQTSGNSLPKTTSGPRRSTLYTDGYWNTVCLPFAITEINSSPFADATIMELDTEGDYDGHQTGFNEIDGILHLFFKTVYDPIEAPDGSTVANMPYILKIPPSDTTQPDNDPTQSEVKFRESATGQTVTSKDGTVSFIGTYTPVTLQANDCSVLYLGEENTLYYPGDEDVQIKSMHAYFKLNGITAGEPVAGEAKIRSISMHFGNEGSADIISLHATSLPTDAAWYTLSGSRLSSKPTHHGLYIHQGKKILIR